MTVVLFLALVLADAPDPRLAFEPARIAVVSVGVDEVPADFERILVESLATGVDDAGDAEVISRDDILQLINVEMQRQLTGCDDASCIVEIGGALNVEAAVAANVTKVGDRWVVVAKLMDMQQARIFRRISRDVSRESRLPTLMRVLGIEVMGGTAPEELLADLGEELPPLVTSWNVGLTAGVLTPQTHYYEDLPVNAKTGFHLAAHADFAVAERVSVGGLLSLSSFSYGKQFRARLLAEEPADETSAVMLYMAGSAKVRFNPWPWLWLRAGVSVGYIRMFITSPEVGDTDGMGAGPTFQVALRVWRGLAAMLDVGFLAQPAGGNAVVSSSFPPMFYVNLGAEWGGVDD